MQLIPSSLLCVLLFVTAVGAHGAPPPRSFFNFVLTNPFGNLCKALLQTPAETYLSANKPWDLSADAQARIQVINDRMATLIDNTGSDDSITNQLEQGAAEVLQILQEERQHTLNPVSRFFFRGAARDVESQTGLYARTLGGLIFIMMGPHYNPIFNRIATPNVNAWRGDSTDFADRVVALHEMQHARDRNLHPLPWLLMLKAIPWDMFSWFAQTPITPSVRFWSESAAMGAQWEIARLIPKVSRAKIKEKLDRRIILLMKDKDFFRRALSLARMNQSFGFHELEDFSSGLAGIQLYLEQINAFLTDFDFAPVPVDDTFTTQELAHFTQTREIDLDRLVPLLEKLEIIEELMAYGNRQGRGTPRVLEALLIKIATETLTNADLPTKEAFLRAQERFHKYSFDQLIDQNFGPSGFKKFALMSTLAATAMWLLHGADTSQMPQVFLTDVNMLFRFIEQFAK